MTQQNHLTTQTFRLLEQFELHHIFLIEWENALLSRLGYPMSVDSSDLIFLVPDDQLHTVQKLAADFGYHAADCKVLPPKYPCEHSSRSLRYIIRDPGNHGGNINPLNRLVLLPLSWTGISRDEAVPIGASANSLPCTVYTVPVSVACTALMRIASREKHNSHLREEIICELCSVIGYHYFDMSYEGDYYVIPPDDEPLSEKEVLEMNDAVNKVKCWEMRKGEEWIRSELIKAMTGAISYDDLPFQND
ncbi:hypothetical protein F5Y05DRAFT_180910 [Hypoxylon sp. FL0543]|nr:hypothetical protein F5Y05DRAFT_180910 [Hypoxylon sp. FL0543]